MERTDIRNIGIFAHVDAGKTTLSEQLLAHSGAIRTRGSVDSGTAHTDTLPVERRRGISVKATCVSLRHRDVQINLIDTPGHVDFSAEIERSLWALDGAILVVCAVEGVQPQTEVLFHAMQEQNIPVVFFINKIDRIGADPERVYSEIRRMLSDRAVMPDDMDLVTEMVCDGDDALFERYLSGEELPEKEVQCALRGLSQKAMAYPVLQGSALKDVGIEDVLDAITDDFGGPEDSGDLSGVVFAAQQDHALGRGVWVRLYGGLLEPRDALPLDLGIDPVTGDPRIQQKKITQIRSPEGEPVSSLRAGEIGIVYGLSEFPIGHVLGAPIPRKVLPGNLRTPVITVQAIPNNPQDMTAMREAFAILSGEDPLLSVQFIPSLNQLHLQVMGTIQLEILEEILSNRFGLAVHFSPPAVIYRETIRQAAEGYVAYLAPKPCWAILRFRIEPAPRGSGVTFVSQVGQRTLKLRYQHQVEQGLPMALSQGRLGWQVTDVKITLIDGNEHQWHTHPLDFIVATPMGIHDGLANGGSLLLEPILEARFLLPQNCVGKVMTDVITMRGEVVENTSDGERAILTAHIPVSESLDYAVTLASATAGRGAMSVRLRGYRECPEGFTCTAPRRSVDPLDTSKYILAARSALEGGIFNY